MMCAFSTICHRLGVSCRAVPPAAVILCTYDLLDTHTCTQSLSLSLSVHACVGGCRCAREREKAREFSEFWLCLYVNLSFSARKLIWRLVNSCLFPLWQRVKACLHCPQWNEFYRQFSCMSSVEWCKILWQCCWQCNSGLSSRKNVCIVCSFFIFWLLVVVSGSGVQYWPVLSFELFKGNLGLV